MEDDDWHDWDAGRVATPSAPPQAGAMLEGRGNIFHAECDAVCITTNGFRKANGDAVMGRGCAKEAAKIVPDLPSILGAQLKAHGNRVLPLLERNGVTLLNYPVKPVSELWQSDEQVVRHMQGKFRAGSRIPGWACRAQLEIILASTDQLRALADAHGWRHVVLPRPGCGAGELSWEIVGPLLAERLDGRFTCMTF